MSATAMQPASTPEPPVLAVERLSLRLLESDGRSRPILQELSFDIRAGETLALVGESGSGKSLTARSILRLLPRNTEVTGRVALLRPGGPLDLLCTTERELRGIRGGEIGFIFQDALGALDPRMRIEDQVQETIRAHNRVSRNIAHKQGSEVLRRVGIGGVTKQDELIPDARRRYPHQLSGGMRQRALIATALVNGPRLLIADEPTTALDTITQAGVLALIRELCSSSGTAVLLITHDLNVAAAFADRIAVLYAGRVVEIGEAPKVMRAPAHPYTRGLLAAHPAHAAPRAPLPELEQPAAADAFVGRCAFAGRCGWRIPDCDYSVPELIEVGPSHVSRCLRGRDVLAAQ